MIDFKKGVDFYLWHLNSLNNIYQFGIWTFSYIDKGAVLRRSSLFRIGYIDKTFRWDLLYWHLLKELFPELKNKILGMFKKDA